MESLIARALESKLSKWLKFFKRDQFKLQGRIAQLTNLDLHGDVLHAALGLPPALRVQQAKVGKLSIKLPPLSNLKTEPMVVSIDRLDIVLAEKVDEDDDDVAPGDPAAASPGKAAASSSSYGLGDKIADGVTIEVAAVNLMLETLGAVRVGDTDSAAWTPPLASITMKGLTLYTTDENWEVVTLKEARSFSDKGKQGIFVFKKLEWQSLSMDLLPHPNMFLADSAPSPSIKGKKRKESGARRVFFGGERLVDSIAGEAHITMARTEKNEPVGLEIELSISEALVPGLSEPGLRALLRFLTGISACITRGVIVKSSPSEEAASKSLVTVQVDHVFVRIKEADFQLELLLQALRFSRASAKEGRATKSLAKVVVGSMFLRDVHSSPPCTLIQPSMTGVAAPDATPHFALDPAFSRVYPLSASSDAPGPPPMLFLYAAATSPPPAAPKLASQGLIHIHPVKLELAEGPLTRIASFFADGVIVKRSAIAPDPPDGALHSMRVLVDEVDVSVHVKLDAQRGASPAGTRSTNQTPRVSDSGEPLFDGFSGARLYLAKLVAVQDPFLGFRVLEVDKDPVCFSFWEGQPVDASQLRASVQAAHVCVALEPAAVPEQTNQKVPRGQEVGTWGEGLWRCIELRDVCTEVGMVSADGGPLGTLPPPEGILRLGVSVGQYTSNSSKAQLLFVLRMAEFLLKVTKAMRRATKGDCGPAFTLPGEEEPSESDSDEGECAPEESARKDAQKQRLASAPSFKSVDSYSSMGSSLLVNSPPADSAVVVKVGSLELQLLESLGRAGEGPPLARLSGGGIKVEASHRALGGAAAVSVGGKWNDVRVECVDVNEGVSDAANGLEENGLAGGGSVAVDSEEGGLAGLELSTSGVPGGLLQPSNDPPGEAQAPEVSPGWADFSSDHARASFSETPESETDPQRGPTLDPAEHPPSTSGNGDTRPPLRSVFWAGHRGINAGKQFIDGSVVYVIPTAGKEGSESLRVNGHVAGVRMGGSMAYNELLLYRTGILASPSEGGPGVGRTVRSALKALKKGGPLFKALGLHASKPVVSPKPAVEPAAPGPLQSWDEKLPDEVDVDVALHDWLFALEGVGGAAGRGSGGGVEDVYSHCWHSRFEKLQVAADSSAKGGKKSAPLQEVMVRIEGLQALKPTTDATSPAPGSGLALQLKLVVNPPSPGTIATSPDFVVEDVSIAVRQPVEAQATKQEIRHLIELCKAEAAAGERVLKGTLKLLEGVGLSAPATGGALEVPNGLSAERLVGSLLGTGGEVEGESVEVELESAIRELEALSCSEEETARLQGVRSRLEMLRGKVGALQRQSNRTGSLV